MKIIDQDIIFLSYDEPNAEENYADLLTKVPWAKRVHGVEGSDAAHKACARLSETENFVTIDGDTIIDPKFLEVELDLEKLNATPEYQFSWAGKIDVNGLMYGNGSIKMWTRDFVNNMKTHENSESLENQVDFCWGVPHENLFNCYSSTVIHSTPQQAFVAGYREGVKMSLDRGKAITAENFKKKMWPTNLRTLSIWMSVGADIQNGQYAMLGARAGCYDTVIGDADINKVRDLNDMERVYEEHTKDIDIDKQLQMYGESIRQRLDIPVAEYDEHESKFFKYAMATHKNKEVQTRERQ